MERRLLIAIILSALVLFFYNLYIGRAIRNGRVPSFKEEKKEEGIQFASSKLRVQDEELTISTNLIDAKLNPNGSIVKLCLKRFRDKKGKPINLAQKAYSLVLSMDGKEVPAYEFCSIDELTKCFFYRIQGTRWMKRIKFNPDKYLIHLTLSKEGKGKQPLSLHLFSPIKGWEEGREKKIEQLYMCNNRVKKVTLGGGFLRLFGKGERTKIIEEKSSWVVHKGGHFLIGLLPKEGEIKSITFKKTEENLETAFLIPRSFECEIYAGPKNYDLLKRLGIGLERVAGLDILSRTILKTLKFFFGITGNFGVSIILLTILIKIILFPLSHLSFKSMKSLQALQPHIRRLKQMYKHDRERLNREIIELYRRHRVNPLGGCLPLLLQLPVFFALFTTLRSAVELRGAHFVFWLKDLSVKDPYYVLPILMGITMFIQQRMSSMEGQSKLFALMPILFTIMFMNFPAGLVLYWLVQNVLTIGQQCLIKIK